MNKFVKLAIAVLVIAGFLSAMPAGAKDGFLPVTPQWTCTGTQHSQNPDGTWNVYAEGHASWWRIVVAGGDIVVGGPQGSPTFLNVSLNPGRYQVQASDNKEQWTNEGCQFSIPELPPPPPPEGEWSATATVNCATGLYQVQVFPPNDEIRFEVKGPIEGKAQAFPILVQIFVTPVGGTEFSMVVQIDGLNTACRNEKESHESTFACLNPTGEEGTYAFRWILPDYTMVGTWQLAASKEGVLTYENAFPSDVFEFRKFPDGTTIDQAREMDPETDSVFVGTSTVNAWLTGLQPGSCTPNPILVKEKEEPCTDCPEYFCEYQDADVLATPYEQPVSGEVWYAVLSKGLVAEGAISLTARDGQTRWLKHMPEAEFKLLQSELRHDGVTVVVNQVQCDVCFDKFVTQDGALVYYGPGSTVWGTARSIIRALGWDETDGMVWWTALNMADQASDAYNAGGWQPAKYGVKIPS